MKSPSISFGRFITFVALTATACGGDDSEKQPCSLTGESGCDEGRVCEPLAGGEPTCFDPVIVEGTVADLTTSAPLGGARVVGIDSNAAPTSTVGISESDGTYTVALAHIQREDATGKPSSGSITLRGDSQGYEPFPSGIRTALPIDLASATSESDHWVIKGALTNLKLAALSGGGAAFIHGKIAATPSGLGALVVAEPAPGGGGPETGFTGIADTDGDYAIYNLAPGTPYVVTPYTVGANYAPVTTDALAAGDNAVADLALANTTGATFAGGLIFNNGANESIQVALAVESTFIPTLDRGAIPPGLTVAGSAAGYSFDGVPDGKYIVLAPFGLTGDVRDVSGGGNTAAPLVTVAGGAVSGTPPSFKIIPAVDLLTIDGTTVGATPVTATSAMPTFTWQKTSVDSNAATYRIEVYDTFGNQTWTTDVDATTLSIQYAGSALTAGMSYLLRIIAIKETIPVPTTYTEQSRTEAVPGVFVYQP